MACPRGGEDAGAKRSRERRAMRRVFTIAAVAGTLVSLAAPAASAADWRPFRTTPFVRTDTCPFPIRGDVVTDKEETRIDSTLPDGSPRVQEFRGPLVMRFTNTSSGRSAVRDLSGYGRIHFFADGASAGYFPDNVGVRIPIGNPGYPAGYYVMHGGVRVTIAADGTREVHAIGHPTIENLCRTLG